MNSIAMQIDYATEEMAMLNRLLLARANYRKLDDARAATKPGADRAIANMKAIDALALVMRLEREYDDMFAPEPPSEPSPEYSDVAPLHDCGETKAEHVDRYIKPKLMTADERADDPRREQSK